MLIRIKKLQFICGVVLMMQVLCPMWIIPFHLIAALLSIVIIGWQKRFCVLQVQYHFYILALYCFRVWVCVCVSVCLSVCLCLCVSMFVSINYDYFIFI